MRVETKLSKLCTNIYYIWKMNKVITAGENRKEVAI